MTKNDREFEHKFFEVEYSLISDSIILRDRHSSKTKPKIEFSNIYSHSSARRRHDMTWSNSISAFWSTSKILNFTTAGIFFILTL